MNILAEPFIPKAIKDVGDKMPQYICYPAPSQFNYLGFINTLEYSRCNFPSTQDLNQINHWEQEPNWDYSEKIHELSLDSSYLNNIWQWVKSEWQARSGRFEGFQQYESRIIMEKENLVRVSVPGLSDSEPPILPGDWVQITYYADFYASYLPIAGGNITSV